jgi:opacity protein-like surface antigen
MTAPAAQGDPTINHHHLNLVMNLFITQTRLRRALITSLFALSAVSLSANWSFGIKAGLAPATGGDVHRGLSFDGSVLLGLPAGSLPVDVGAKSFDDVYSKFEEIAFEASYAAGENLAYILGVSWLSSNEGNLTVGTVAGTLPLNGRFSEYEDFQIYAGLRYNFRVTERWNPYVTAQLGYTQVDEITASFSVPGTPFNAPYQAALTNAKFYDATNLWTYGLLVGMEYKFNDRASLALETGYFRQGGLKDNDSVLGLLGLNALNDEGKLSYLPVRLSLSFRF